MAIATHALRGEQALDRQLKALANQFPREAKRALVRAGKRTVTRARRELAGRYQLPVKALRKRMGSYPQRGLSVHLWIGLKHGVKLSELSSGRLRRVTGMLGATPFEATMPSGHRGLFFRDVTKSRRYRVEGARVREDGQRTELPIVEAEVKVEPATALATLERHGKEQLTGWFPRELRRLLDLKAARTTRKAR